MTATVGLIVFMLAIVISIILGTKLKMNIGMVALAFTFLIGVTLSGLSGRSVSGLFPTNIFVTQLVATFFYGFASLNGAFNGIADRIIYRTKKVKGALPFVVLLCTILLSMMGAGAEATPVIMSPIAFMLSAEAGFHPILASLAVWVGSVCTIGATWTPGGAVAYSIWSPHLGEEAADATSLYIMLLLIAIGFITMLVVDFIYRKDLKEIEMEEPAPFTPIQKRSLMIVVIALLLMLIPAVLEALAPNPVRSGSAPISRSRWSAWWAR